MSIWETAKRFDSSEPRDTQLQRLSDGRTIEYVDCGDPDGVPIFYFHGTPSNHREAEFTSPESLGVRLITPNRPGSGRSTPVAGRRLLDWPSDVVELADALGIDRFAVVGASGGGPYALACAFAIPNRLTGCAVLSGIAPMDDPRARKEVNVVERSLIRLSNRRPVFARKLLGNAAEEYRILGDAWGFDLEAVPLGTDIWYGTSDWFLSPYHAKLMATRLPNVTLHALPATGHIASVLQHADSVLATLVERR